MASNAAGDDKLRKIIALQQVQLQNLIPAGTILPYAGKSIPDGWLACDGRSYLKQEHKKLYDAIGTLWGAKDNKSFNVPDLRGYFLRGLDSGALRDADCNARGSFEGASSSGCEVGTIQSYGTSLKGIEIKTATDGSHKHDYNGVGGHPWNGAGPYYTVSVDMNSKNTKQAFIDVDGSNHSHAINVANDSSETRPKNVAVNYIIKF